MELIIVNEDKCKQDGLCAGECPLGIIRLEENGYPHMVTGGDEACLLCGHCVAACPHGALDHKLVPREQCPEINKALKINEAEAIQFLRSRRSIRLYKGMPVEKEKIQKLIEIARYAPTGGNTQTVEWLVFTDKDKIRQLAGMTVDWMRHVLQEGPESSAAPYYPFIVAAWDAGHDTVLRDAPVILLASAPQEARNGMVDLTLALSYLDLAAPTLGLGTCWAGLLQAALLEWPPLREAVGLPEGYPNHYPMMLGYPRTKYLRLPERKPPLIDWK